MSSRTRLFAPSPEAPPPRPRRPAAWKVVRDRWRRTRAGILHGEAEAHLTAGSRGRLGKVKGMGDSQQDLQAMSLRLDQLERRMATSLETRRIIVRDREGRPA